MKAITMFLSILFIYAVAQAAPDSASPTTDTRTGPTPTDTVNPGRTENLDVLAPDAATPTPPSKLQTSVRKEIGDFQNSMQQRLRQLDTKLNDLQVRGDTLNQAGAAQTMSRLRGMRQQLSSRINGINDSTQDAWGTTKVEIERQYQDLVNEVDKATLQ